MRFCLITTFFPPYHFGGDGVFVAHLANALSADGHHVEVIHCADSFRLTQGTVEASPFHLDPAIRVHTLESPLGPLSPVLTFLTGEPFLKTKKLRDVLEQGFDVIHWHNVSLVGGPGALKLGSAVKLCTLHEYWFLCPTNILFKNKEQACTARSCFRCQIAYRRPPQPWRYTSLLAHSRGFIDRFLAPSRFVQQTYRNAPEAMPSTVLSHFIPDEECLVEDDSGGRHYYLYVGRLEKAKGLQTVIPLFRNTRRHLTIAGAGTYESELRELAAGDPNIEFLGRVPHANLAALYRGARATVVPSICYETFGLVSLESLRHGTPVVSSGYGGLPEIIETTGGGLVFRNSGELGDILDRIDEDPEFAISLGRHGAANLDSYSVHRHLQNYYRIIEEVRREQETVY